MKALPLHLERVPGGGVPGLSMHAPAFRGGHGEGAFRHMQQGFRTVLGDQAVLVMTAEAAVADAVQGHRETARSHGFERGQIEALLHMGQADRDSALGQQTEEGVPVGELCEQQVFDALRIESLGQASSKFRALVADDRDRQAPFFSNPAGEPSPAGSKGVTSIPFGIVRTGPFVRPVAEIASATSWLTQMRTALSAR